MLQIERVLVWLCVGIAFAVLLIGLADLGSPILSARLYAAVLVLTTLFVFVGAYALTHGWTRLEAVGGASWRVGEPLLLVGMAAMTLHAALFLLLWQYESADGTRSASATGALIIGAVGVATVWWFRSAREQAWQGLAKVGRTVGSIGVTAGVVSTVVFNLYDTQPHTRGVGPSLSIAPSATLLGEQEGYLVVQVAVAMKNVGKGTVQTIGSLYVARAVDVQPGEISDDRLYGNFPTRHRATNELSLEGMTSRYGTDATTELASFGTVVPGGAYLEPDQETVRAFNVRVPKGPFDAVHLVVAVGIGDGGRLRLRGSGRPETDSYEVDANAARVAGTAELTRIVWPIQEPTALRWLRRTPRVAVVDLVERVRPVSAEPEQVARAAAYGPSLFPCVAHRKAPSCQLSSVVTLSEQYGVALTLAQMDIPLLSSPAK